MPNHSTGVSRKPSRALSFAVSGGLATVWAVLRLVVFHDFLFPLTYVLPLLVCVWSRDRVALWIMAALFVAFHTIGHLWLLDPTVTSGLVGWATYGATLTNILVGTIVVHAVIALRDRLEESLAQVHAQADELRAQGDELSAQAEELAAQNEELTSQSDELKQQNEEVLSQRQQIEQLNEELERRASLLQMLLDVSRASGGEQDALQRICDRTLALFGEPVRCVIIYDCDGADLVVRAAAGAEVAQGLVSVEHAARAFVMLALEQGRAAALDDVALRPDLTVFGSDGQPPVRAVLVAPMQAAAGARGVIALYSHRVHHWTDEQFRLAEWLADQAGRVLHTLRLQNNLRQQAEALRETDRSKNQFLATLSHELRNPLAPIRYALQLLGRPNQPAQPDPRLVIERQIAHLVRLVDDLLDATRISSNKIQLRKQHVDLVPLARHAVDCAMPEIERAEQAVDVSLPSSPIWLDADPDRLTQVLANLLNNASRYTPPGGRIRISARADGGDVVLSVADTGIGLETADVGRVFDMFTQVGGPGTGGLGIGLALVKGIVELHGGSVEARSEGIGRGSDFIVRLPAAAAASQDVARSEELPPPGASPRRVLVVDDNADSAAMMAAVLELHGHEVRVACDGHQALSAAAEFVPDVALLDIGLPGLTGYEVARRIRTDPRTSGARLIAVTGWGHEEDRQRALESGFDAHLTKPADPERIVDLVARSTLAPDDVLPG